MLPWQASERVSLVKSESHAYLGQDEIETTLISITILLKKGFPVSLLANTRL